MDIISVIHNSKSRGLVGPELTDFPTSSRAQGGSPDIVTWWQGPVPGRAAHS